jgi:hypothetical protein
MCQAVSLPEKGGTSLPGSGVNSAFPIENLILAKETKTAEYSLTHDKYVTLLVKLSKRKFDLTKARPARRYPELYSDCSVSIETKKDKVGWQSVLTEPDSW